MEVLPLKTAHFFRQLPQFFVLISVLISSGCHPPSSSFKPSFETPLSLWKNPPFEKKPMPSKPLPVPSKDISPLFGKPVSFSLSEGGDLKEALLNLCRSQEMNLMIRIPFEERALQTYTCVQKPFIDVLTEISALLNARCRIEGSTAYIEEDTPYIQTHVIPFPLGQRHIHHHAHVINTGFGALDGSSSHNAQTDLSSTTSVDFWDELERTLQFILQESPQMPSPPSSVPLQKPLPSSFERSARRTVRLLTTLPLERSAKKYPQKETPPLNIPPQHLSSHHHYALHKQAGLISIYGTQKQHHLIHNYLRTLKKLTHTQITIEAQILEVLLKDTFKKGIDWNLLTTQLQGHLLGTPESGIPFLTLGFTQKSFEVLFHLLSHFGSVRTLSNPRLTVLNNQPALMKVAKNEVFFQLEVDRVLSSDNKPDLETTTSRMQTIPIGLVLTVQPSVDLETKEVTLALRPTLSRVVEMRDDPAVSLRSENKIHSQVPVVQVREFDSLLKIRSHETLLMGGLMEECQTSDRTSLPIASNSSFAELFLSKQEKTSLFSELVILLTVWLEDEDRESI